MKYLYCVFFICISSQFILSDNELNLGSFPDTFIDTPVTKVDTFFLQKALTEETSNYQTLILSDSSAMKDLFLKYISNQNNYETSADRQKMNLELINPACREYLAQVNDKYLNEFGTIREYKIEWFRPPCFCVHLRTGSSKVFNHSVTFECCKINGIVYFRSCHNISRKFINLWVHHEELKAK
ncbi:MAG: hypothetical protein MUC87_05835 [Bacteroidia bacterium]|nr:hypothetical protein [Bacteroidia bacterium]